MADQEDVDGADDAEVAIRVKDLKALRNIARSYEEAAPKLATAERELAFAKAKLDLTDPKLRYFIKGYEGDLEPEEIRKAALEAGFITEGEKVPKEELKGHEALGEAAAGGEAGEKDLTQAIAEAKSPEEVMRIMIAAGRPTSWNRPSDR